MMIAEATIMATTLGFVSGDIASGVRGATEIRAREHHSIPQPPSLTGLLHPRCAEDKDADGGPPDHL
jgi:hypothetical protein